MKFLISDGLHGEVHEQDFDPYAQLATALADLHTLICEDNEIIVATFDDSKDVSVTIKIQVRPR